MKYSLAAACAQPLARILLASILHLLLVGAVRAQLDQVLPANDTAVLLHSTVLDQPRSIWIHIPPSYQSTDQTYPVLYVLDGDTHFKYTGQLVDYLSSYDCDRIPEMIVVGIVNIDRGKDMTLANPPSTTQGAVKFIEYIRQEVISYIDNHYRTAPYRVLMGHSLAGQFALYTKDSYPDLFKATILVSPAIQDYNDKLIAEFGDWLQQRQPAGKLFVGLGGERTQKVDKIVQQLNQLADPSFQWSYRQYPDDNHFSVPYKTMFDALKFIYKDWFIDFYDNYIQAHPNSYNAFDSMGEAYMKRGDKKLAILNYEKSIELNPNNENGKQMLKKLRADP